jgi:hypothetical protein
MSNLLEWIKLRQHWHAVKVVEHIDTPTFSRYATDGFVVGEGSAVIC